MRHLGRSRLAQLERRMHVDEPPMGRLLFLIPDLWLEADQAAFHDPERREPLEDLVERRTGVRPTFDMDPSIWAIVVPASEEMRALEPDEKAAFLEELETRPLAQWQRRERS